MPPRTQVLPNVNNTIHLMIQRLSLSFCCKVCDINMFKKVHALNIWSTVKTMSHIFNYFFVEFKFKKKNTFLKTIMDFSLNKSIVFDKKNSKKNEKEFL